MTRQDIAGRTLHTPGPWSVYSFGETLSVCIGKKPNGKRPCVVDWPGFDSCDLPYKRRVANAYLIAAAPDLVKALEECSNFLRDLTDPDKKASGPNIIATFGNALALSTKVTAALAAAKPTGAA